MANGGGLMGGCDAGRKAPRQASWAVVTLARIREAYRDPAFAKRFEMWKEELDGKPR